MAKIQKKSKQQFHLIPFFYFPPKDCPSGSHQTIFPQNSRNTETTDGEYPPTDFTDVHRFFFSASRFCVFREFCGKIVLWQPYPRCPPNSFHRTHSKFVCASPPTEFTEFTEVSGGEYPPTDFTDVHRFFFSASRFCVFREFCGKIVLWQPYPRCPPNSFHRTHSKFVCASPPTEFTEYTEASGGGYSPTEFTEFTEASGGE